MPDAERIKRIANRAQSRKERRGKRGTLRGGVLGVKSFLPHYPCQLPHKSKEITAEDQSLKNAITQRAETLRKTIEVILGDMDPRTRAQYQKFIEMTSDGVLWRDISATTGLLWPDITRVAQHPGWSQLYRIARDLGEDIRKALRESVAHDRAINGVNKPVYQGGALVGHVTEVDNRLLEFLLKADNPKKYRDNSQINVNTGVVSTVVTFHRDIPQVIDVEDVKDVEE